MLKRYERYMRVYSSADPDKAAEALGYYPISMSYRTSEEVEAGDVLYTNLRYSAYASARRAPDGGYKRGMVLESPETGERYHVLVPTLSGKVWIMKVERAMLNGEGETYGRF